jgi:poly(ADP-ribose) glycohydrolase ARH3
MRVAPIALFTIDDPDPRSLVQITINVSRITHTHPVGIAGGIFQAIAVRQGLLFGARASTGTSEQSHLEILDAFEKEYLSVVQDTKAFPEIKDGWKVYAERIKTIRRFIEGGAGSWSLDDVRTELGVKVTSSESIPTALFCFLASFHSIPNFEAENQFERTVMLALALGGDTDTIGSMAGAICGAYVGYEGIHENFVRSCEDFERLLDLATSLHSHYMNTTGSKI